ncbi:tetratricopeptide repeat-containing sulfotransferase family protein [Lysobacter tyrosinilyticus]
MLLLALALSAQQRGLEALPLHQRLVELEPEVPEHWSNLGNCLCEVGRESEAEPSLLQACKLGADDAAVHYGLARVYAYSGPVESARRHIELAIAHEPQDAELRLLRASILAATEQWAQAGAEISLLLQLPMDAGQRSELGYLYLRGNQYEEAIAIFRNPPADPALSADYQIGLISALERINRLDEAIQLRREFPALPDDARATLRDKLQQVDAKLAARAGDHARAAALLQDMIDRYPAQTSAQTSNWFDLGAARAKIGEADAAMTAFARAHEGQCALVDVAHPSLSSDTSVPALLEQALPKLPAWEPGAVLDGPTDPVFVVGFPRSGTTLLEQLLDAHTDLVSFDEQPFLQRLVLELTDSGRPLREALEALDGATIDTLRRVYFRDVNRVVSGLGGRRAVDKNPLNMVRLPLLQSIFPRAQTVLAIRHPCDVVLSCYMQNFRSPVLALHFNTIENTARMYDQVFSHWLAAQADFHWPVFVLRNEDLIADTEATTRSLFEYLRLPWQPDLLAFTDRASRKGAIKTPSYTQVIEKVNAKAVGRWERYRDYFNPAAIAALAPWVRHFGYSPID